MPTSKHAPQQPLEQPAVIRTLIESQTIPWQDMAALCLANKAVFRLAYREEKRYKIKNVPFSHSQNLLRYLIDTDSRDGLDEALKLAEFERDTTSPNGRLLHDENGGGINTLMKLCIDYGASRCLDLLITWADDPAVLFTYDCVAVYEHAKRAALRHGILNCLLYMQDRDVDGLLLACSSSQQSPDTTTPPLQALYTTLLQSARSPQAVVRLARRMPEGTDYLPILAAQCGNRYSHPALIEVLLGLITTSPASPSEKEEEEEEEKPEQAGTGASVDLVPAVCAAASVLHVNALDVLLRRGAKAFAAVCGRGVERGGVEASAGENPLFCAVVFPLPGRPEIPRRGVRIWAHSLSRVGGEGEAGEGGKEGLSGNGVGVKEEGKESRQQLHARWQTETEQVAAAMKLVVDYLVNTAKHELRQKHPQLLADIFDHAAMVYLFNLRTLLLRNLPWLFEHDEQLMVKLLVPAMADSLVEGSDGEDESDENELVFTWRKGLSGRQVEKRLWKEGVSLADDFVRIWLRLVTPTTIDMAWSYLKVWPEDLGGCEPFDLLWELLVAEERGVPVQ